MTGSELVALFGVVVAGISTVIPIITGVLQRRADRSAIRRNHAITALNDLTNEAITVSFAWRKIHHSSAGNPPNLSQMPDAELEVFNKTLFKSIALFEAIGLETNPLKKDIDSFIESSTQAAKMVANLGPSAAQQASDILERAQVDLLHVLRDIIVKINRL